VVGTFNPGAVEVGDEVVILLRVAETVREVREGWVGLPSWNEGSLVIDWALADEVEQLDPRIVRRKVDGLVRLTFTSHLRVLRSRDGKAIDDLDAGRFIPQTRYETFGVEDPRITKLDDRYYITYVSVSSHGAATSLASTTDFQRFERHGVIFHPENKDVVLLPDRVGGEYVAIHRPNAATPFCSPQMWVSRSPDLKRWGRHEYLLGGGAKWSTGRVGAGAPPLRTDHGWLEIYHGNDKSVGEHGVGSYFGAAVLLDLDDPSRVIGHSDGPIMGPEADFERHGFVPNVVFPTGVVEREDRLLVYYGAADANTGVVEFDRAELMDSLVACEA
jgi:predicted GH43/DUF377 family glycosyl hydrolase